MDEFFKRFLWATHLTFKRLRTTPMKVLGGEGLAALAEGEDRVTGHKVWSKVVLGRRGDRVVSFYLTQWRPANEEYDPQAVEDFMRASLLGYEYAVANPEEAVAATFELIEAAGNQAFLVEEGEQFRWETESAIVEAATPVGLEIGMIDLLRLGEEIALMTELGVFAEEPDWSTMVDPTIVETIYG